MIRLLRRADTASTPDVKERKRENPTTDAIAERLALAESVVDNGSEPNADEVRSLALEVIRLRDYAEQAYELLQADSGNDVLDEIDKRLRKLYMGLNGERRWSHGVGLLRLLSVDAKDVPAVDVEGDQIDQWDRLVALSVWATTYAVAQGRWAVLEHRQADAMRDALLNGVDWFGGTDKPPLPRRVGHDYHQETTEGYVNNLPCMICGGSREGHGTERVSMVTYKRANGADIDGHAWVHTLDWFDDLDEPERLIEEVWRRVSIRPMTVGTTDG